MIVLGCGMLKKYCKDILKNDGGYSSMVEHWFVAPGIWVRFPVATPPGTLGSMDRASGFGPEGWGFESLRVHI